MVLRVDELFAAKGLSSVNNLEDITDEPRERYTKLKRFATDFAILQYGIACFRWNEEQKKWVHKTSSKTLLFWVLTPSQPT